MKKQIVALSFVFLLITVLFSVAGSKTNGAVLGDNLPTPENGWKRYDDTDKAIIKEGYSTSRDGTPYQGSYSYTPDNNKPIYFDFTGDKVRIISRKWNTTNYYAEKVQLVIDGEVKKEFSIHGPTQNQTLMAEVVGLENKRHKAIIRVAEGYSKGINLDAIDIDENGELLAPDNNDTKMDARLYSGNSALYKLQSNGDLYAWGNNNYGQLGSGDTNKRTISTMSKVLIPEPITDIVIGNRFVIALGKSGNVYGWGDNTSLLFNDEGGLILSPVKFDKDIQSIIKAE